MGVIAAAVLFLSSTTLLGECKLPDAIVHEGDGKIKSEAVDGERKAVNFRKVISHDFDGDGVNDCAAFFLAKNGKEIFAISSSRNSKKNDFWQMLDEGGDLSKYMDIQLISKATVSVLCDEVDGCDVGERKELSLKNGAVSYYVIGGAERIIYFDSEINLYVEKFITD